MSGWSSINGGSLLSINLVIEYEDVVCIYSVLRLSVPPVANLSLLGLLVKGEDKSH